MDVMVKNRFNLLANVKTSRLFGSGADADVVEFDEIGCPMSLLGCCHHFDDAEKNWRALNFCTPMDDMIKRVKDLGLSRPK
jgi:hypothetical protein